MNVTQFYNEFNATSVINTSGGLIFILSGCILMFAICYILVQCNIIEKLQRACCCLLLIACSLPIALLIIGALYYNGTIGKYELPDQAFQLLKQIQNGQG